MSLQKDLSSYVNIISGFERLDHTKSVRYICFQAELPNILLLACESNLASKHKDIQQGFLSDHYDSQRRMRNAARHGTAFLTTKGGDHSLA